MSTKLLEFIELLIDGYVRYNIKKVSPKVILKGIVLFYNNDTNIIPFNMIEVKRKNIII